MNNFKIASLYAAMMAFVVITGCREVGKQAYYTVSGPAMGTKYHITVEASNPEIVQKSIDSILADFNLSMSAYIDSSTLTHFNTADSVFCYDSARDPYFEPVFLKSKELYQQTGGALNPCIAPLARYYGFLSKQKKTNIQPDTAEVQKLMSFLMFDSLKLDKSSTGNICIRKPKKEVNLDFNSLSPGYAVDVISRFLEQHGIMNYMIEVGGEIRTRGVNERKTEWVIGINKPSEKASETDVELPLKLSGKSLATSGNYRNFYKSGGKTFAHIINPFTGMSQPSDILSATVIADDCITADGLATAFMVLGLEKALELSEKLSGIDAFFIFDKEGDGVFEFKESAGFGRYYLHNEQK